MKHELQNIISGKSNVSNGDTIQAITRYLEKAMELAERISLPSKSKVKKQSK